MSRGRYERVSSSLVIFDSARTGLRDASSNRACFDSSGDRFACDRDTGVGWRLLGAVGIENKDRSGSVGLKLLADRTQEATAFLTQLHLM